MTVLAIQNVDVALLIFGVPAIYAAIWLIGSRAVDRILAGRTFDSQGRERVGLSPTLSLAQEQQAKARRGRFFHVTRHGRSA